MRGVRAAFVDLAVPLGVGAIAIAVGVLVGKAMGWSTGAYWVLGVVVTAAVVLAFARRDLVRQRAQRKASADPPPLTPAAFKFQQKGEQRESD